VSDSVYYSVIQLSLKIIILQNTFLFPTFSCGTSAPLYNSHDIPGCSGTQARKHWVKARKAKLNIVVSC